MYIHTHTHNHTHWKWSPVDVSVVHFRPLRRTRTVTSSSTGCQTAAARSVMTAGTNSLRSAVAITVASVVRSSAASAATRSCLEKLLAIKVGGVTAYFLMGMRVVVQAAETLKKQTRGEVWNECLFFFLFKSNCCWFIKKKKKEKRKKRWAEKLGRGKMSLQFRVRFTVKENPGVYSSNREFNICLYFKECMHVCDWLLGWCVW